MANELQIFNHPVFGELEVLVKEGKEYFPANDSAKLLGYANPRDAISRHCKKEGIAVLQNTTEGNSYSKKFINEGNLYRLIVKSKLSAAEKFESWIFDEVLPSIRKYGAYMTSTILEQIKADSNAINGLLINLEEEQKARIAAEQLITEQVPKVEAYNTFMNAVNTLTLTDVAKSLGMSGIKLCKILRDLGVLLGNSNNSPSIKYLNKGYFKVVLVPDHNGSIVKQTRVTPIGVDFISGILKLHMALNA